MSLVQPPTEDLEKIWKRIVDAEDTDVSWVICNFLKKKKKNPRKQRLQVVAYGPGGVEDFLTLLNDDEVAFVGFRVTGLDSRGGVTSKRTKLGFINWTGEHTNSMLKAKLAGFFKDVKDYFDGVHLTINAHTRADVTVQDLEKQLRAAGGAHQVQKYDFRNGYEGEVGTGVTSLVGDIKNCLNAVQDTGSNDAPTTKVNANAAPTPSATANNANDEADKEEVAVTAATEGVSNMTVSSTSKDESANPPVPSLLSSDGPKVTILITSQQRQPTWSHVTDVTGWVVTLMGGNKELLIASKKLEIVDGMDLLMKDRRNELFALGERAKYPQLFVDEKFVGTYDKIDELNEDGQLAKIVTVKDFFKG
eukprot:g432.t1